MKIFLRFKFNANTNLDEKVFLIIPKKIRILANKRNTETETADNHL